MGHRFRMAAAAAIILLASGCNKEATGQTVAVVNGIEISQSELNDELAAANVPANADKKQVMPQLLQRIIDRKLLVKTAIDQGIDKSPEYISRQRRLNDELLVGLLGQRKADTIKIPNQAEIDQFIKENPGMFGQRQILALNQLQFAPPANLEILKKLNDNHSLDDVASTLNALNIPFTRNTSNLDTAKLPPKVLAQINGLPAGEPFVVPSGGKIVVSVITGRETAAASIEQSRSLAAQMIARKRLSDLMDTQLKDARSKAEIKYQPGFEPKPAPKGGPAAPASTPDKGTV